ncbi:interferon gamma receptor 2 isoform X2 [Erinaceus europaeus]|uniref:Interferon gamma receptor 2 isoform X2 n=1 Tax=Erinaceus europaeus TaxID=9365 RepID=A0ABM3Y0P5_ERIEU|nr:interferon gamma receptor 2 isoform X2 [Erinaceus europaeus]
MTRRVAAQSRAMRPPPLLLLLLLGCGAAAPPTGWPSQLPAPKNVKLHLYNTQQVLSWDPVTPGEDPRPLVYQVRAKQGELTSAWTRVPQFMPYQNATIGPPQNLKVMAGEGSLLLHLSPPFDVHRALVKLQYQVRYWEKGTDDIQTKGPLGNSSINLEDLKPLRVYCLQVRAQIEIHGILNSGLFQNASCYETKATATSRLQQTILIVVGTFSLLSVLMGTFLFLFLRYRGLLKYWFHTPPSIPLQIEEYLKEPNQPILEALDNSPKDDAWDSVSIISFPEKEQKEVFQSTLNQSTNEAHQPEEKGLSSR